MKVINILTISSAVLYAYMAVSVLTMMKKKFSSITLSGSSAAMFYFNVLIYFSFHAENAAQRGMLISISIPGLIVFMVMQHLFILNQYSRITPTSLFLLFTLSSVCLFINAKDLWKYILQAYIVIIYSSGLYILIKKYKAIKLKREMKKIELLLYSSTVSLLLVLAEYLSQPVLSQFLTISFTPILFIPWCGGYIYAIKRYQLLSITPENLTRKIIEAVDELIILADFKGKPTYFNKKAENFFRGTGKPMQKYNFKIILNSNDQPEHLLAGIKEGTQIERRLVLNKSENSAGLPLINFEITAIKDKFEDPLGYLLIGKEFSVSEKMERKFKLSERETEVASGIINGLNTRAIAGSLGIAERTVKSHTGSIFKKTGVSDKVELIMKTIKEDC